MVTEKRITKKRRPTRGEIKEKGMHLLFLFAACISVIAVVTICVFLFAQGLPTIGEIGVFDFLFGKVWKPDSDLYGIFPMIVGSIYVTAGAIIVGVPLALLCAIFLAKFCPPKLYKMIKPAINLMSGIPSVVYGYFGLMVIVPFMQNTLGGSGKGILTASILLGIMILPTVIGVAESAIHAVPDSYYEGSLALGATHERSVFSVVFPAAKSGIFAGVILGVGRAIGETMAVIMVAGNQEILPDSILSGVRTMTANIVIEMAYSADGSLHRRALIATGVVLFVFILIINISFSLLKRKEKN